MFGSRCSRRNDSSVQLHWRCGCKQSDSDEPGQDEKAYDKEHARNPLEGASVLVEHLYLGFFIPHRAPSLRLQRLRDHERERHLEALFGYRRRHVLGHVVRFWGWEELDLKVLVNG